MLERLEELYLYASEASYPWKAHPWDDPWPWEEQTEESSASDPTWGLILDQEMPF